MPTPPSARDLWTSRYRYREREDNQLWPVATAATWPWWREQYSPAWLARFVPGVLAAHLRRALVLARIGLDRVTFRFDKLAAYDRILGAPKPRFAEAADCADAFAWWRIAGSNAVSLVQEPDLASLLDRIPLDRKRVEAYVARRRGRPVPLEDEASAGRLFSVDFELIRNAQRPARDPCVADLGRDSRWRAKYLPAPIGVFLEAPGFFPKGDLVPLAIRVDQPDASGRNPVHHPDGDPWAWRIAKAYFEVADVSFHAGCGHVSRTHLRMEPFALTTPRKLPPEHPVHKLLRPHLRFTLTANRAAYRYFIGRKHTYFDFYAGTLEETRQIAIDGHEPGFRALALERDLSRRKVGERPCVYPYRDDARLWVGPIRDFVTAYVAAFYPSDRAVVDDAPLQAWAEELMDPRRGNVKDLVEDEHLDGRGKLVDVLAEVLFTAGPGHAAQHYASNHYYRYAPAFPGSAYVPPAWQPGRHHEARFRNLLPPIRTAARQWTYNTFTDFRYDRFGHYEGYPLADVPQAREPIRRLQAALHAVDREIASRAEGRLHPYEFLRPPNVPNSIHI